MERKQQIRQELKSRRERLTMDEVRAYSTAICRKIAGADFFGSADVVYFYYPKEKEVSLLTLAELALCRGKRVAFPKVEGPCMDFYEVSSLDEFEPGRFGILEPKKDTAILCSNPLVLAPGVGFDRKGGRIGYGKGYYDRYLEAVPGAFRVGVAYRCQLTEELPLESCDIPMHLVITEQDWLEGTT